MKHLLLLATGLASALTLSAATPPVALTAKASDNPVTPLVVKKQSKADDSRTVKQLPVVAKRHAIAGKAKKESTINPSAVRRAPAKASQEGVSFFESFEGYDGESALWAPEGWTIESNGDATLTDIEKWGAIDPAAFMGYLTAYDGQYAMAIMFAEVPQDEWLIMPELTIAQDEELSFYVSSTPFFFYDSEKADWDLMDFTERVLTGDLEVLVKAEGETEYTKVYSWMEQFDDLSFMELLEIDGYRKQTVDISAYAGKKISIAFRYYANNCNALTIDAVRIGYPALEDVSYMQPFETLYFGFDSQPGFGYVNLPAALYAVNAPLTWTNMTWIDGATYSWDYHDPVTNEMEVSNEQDALTVTYAPDFTSDFTKRNNMYYPPVLRANKPGASEGTYTVNYMYLQAGGRPEFEVKDKEGNRSIMDLTMFPFEPNTDGFYALAIDDETIGDMSLPVFGYNSNVDQYWINYTYNGETPEPGDYSHLNAIINFIYPPSEGGKLVVEGANVYALGNFKEGADITFDLQLLSVSEEYVPDAEHPLATAQCSLADIISAEGSVHDLLTIPFTFDTPMVLDNSNTAYVIRFSGFRNEAVEYFAPVQSMMPNADGLCHGWLEFEKSITGFGVNKSYSPIANTEGPEGECLNGFAIGLRGCYPYLTCETTEVTIPGNGDAVNIPMQSFYDGADLTIEGAEGMDASIAGRYDATVLTLKGTANTPSAATIKVTAPGVSHTIKTNFTSGIDAVGADSNAKVGDMFTPDGRRVNPDDAGAGIYVVKYSDGKVAKIRR